MRRKKTGAARRIRPPVNAALEAITGSAHANLLRQSRPCSNTRDLVSSETEVNHDDSRVHTPQKAAGTSRRAHHLISLSDLHDSHSPRALQLNSTSERGRKSSRSFHAGWRSANPTQARSRLGAWQQLPTMYRMCSLLLGFFTLYYFIFAKHHYYDSEIRAIHTDVEKLLRETSNSILSDNLVEAVLPDIFNQTLHQSAIPELVIANDTANRGTHAVSPESARFNPNKTMPLRPKLNKERWKPNGSAISEKGLNPQSTSTNSSVPPGAAKKNDPETVNGSSERKIQNPESINSVVPRHKVKTETIVNHNVKHAENNKTSGKFATGSQVTQGSSETPLKEKKSTNEQSPMGEPSASPSSGGDLSIGITSNSQKSKASHHQGYNLDFKELGADDVPKGHVPVLNWNYNAVIDAETSQQVFASGDKFHHVAVYKPLCIEADTGQAIRFSGKRVCGGYNRTAGWMIQYCSVLRKSLPKEILLNMKSDDETKQWLDDNRSQIRWVGGLTILQVMEKNCGNIAHFAGRILMLQHIVDNIAAYAAPPSIVENILILPTWDIMKRFLYPHNYEYWHKSVFSALVAPAKFFIGTLGNFIYRESKVSFSGLPRVQLLHNFSMTGSAEQEKKFVCFRRAVVPGFLKGRFFADDREYPSKQPSLQTSMTGAPHIPRDSLRFREKVRALYHSSPYLPQTQKEVVFLDRNGSRRVLDESSKSKVVHLFQNVSLEKGYRFKIVSFDNMPFKEQYETMTAASIAIGIHGANLVNTMFMPPLSVLFELFPFGFEHDMYINGGNSGLKYFKYQMQTGLPFNGPKQFRTVEQCIKLSHECKVHFRDSTLQVTANDLEEMERILREAVRWCDDQPAVSHHQGIS